VILTDSFVCLNYPRTGSTFARTVLRAVYGHDRPGLLGRWHAWRDRGRFRELSLRIDRTRSARRSRRRTQHGAVHQIPASHRGLPILSVLRHPLDRVVSQYEHGFWRTYPPGSQRAIRARFPNFPDIDFAQYLELQREFGRIDVQQDARVDESIGPDTLHFVRFFAPDPERALARLTPQTIESGEAIAELADVRFLRFESLTEDLLRHLEEIGFDQSTLAFVDKLPRINAATSRKGRDWRDYFTPTLEAEYRERERLLFMIQEGRHA
jgi:hypothetical protein